MQLLMWAVIVLAIIVFVGVIIIGYSTDYGFLFGFQNVPSLSETVISNNNVII